MQQEILFKKLVSYLPKRCWLTSINQMSSKSMKNEDSDCIEQVSTTDEVLKDLSNEVHNTEEVSRLLEEAATFKDANDKSWATSPYPKDIPLKDNENTKPFVDPRDTNILLFPGQGTIKVGTIKKYLKFPEARDLFQIANEIINYDLMKLCLNGPQEVLTKTKFNQAATVVSSLAALEKIRAEDPKVFESCVATAGYSVGEISALVLSGAISFEDGVRLAWNRGKAMQYASDKVPQGMLAVFCTPQAQIHQACQAAEKWAMDLGVENPVCRVAIYLHTERKILAGNAKALEYIEAHQTQYGLKNAVRLPVSGAFHTPLMEPALKSIFQTLTEIKVNDPRCTVYSNYKGEPFTSLRYMKKFMLKQVVSPVKWEQCLQQIYRRPNGTQFPRTYDVGSEGRMKAILHLINAKASRSCITI